VNGNLIQIVRTSALQGNKLSNGREIDIQDVSVQGHFANIGPRIGYSGLGHALMDGVELVLRHHNV
jgi:hypothetical protein